MSRHAPPPARWQQRATGPLLCAALGGVFLGAYMGAVTWGVDAVDHVKVRDAVTLPTTEREADWVRPATTAASRACRCAPRSETTASIPLGTAEPEPPVIALSRPVSVSSPPASVPVTPSAAPTTPAASQTVAAPTPTATATPTQTTATTTAATTTATTTTATTTEVPVSTEALPTETTSEETP